MAVSEEMKKLKILPPPAVSVGVSYAGNWLELKVDAEGMSRQELLKILDSYRSEKEILPPEVRGISGAEG